MAWSLRWGRRGRRGGGGPLGSIHDTGGLVRNWHWHWHWQCDEATPPRSKMPLLCLTVRMMMWQTGSVAAAPVAHDRVLTRMPVALSLGLDQAARADDVGGASATTSSSASGTASASGSAESRAKLASPPPPGSGRGTGTGGGLPVPASLARSEPEPARDLAESKIQAKHWQMPWPLSTSQCGTCMG